MALTCVGVVLAGGRSKRFGAEKAMAEVEGATLLARVHDVLQRGCDEVAINTSSSHAAATAAARWNAPRLDDAIGVAAGPLAGVLAGLDWASARGAEWLATAPCDTPRLPADLVERLLGATHAAAGAIAARTPERAHPLCAVWRVSRRAVVAEALAGGAHPPVRRVLAALDAVELAFDDAAAFANVNTVVDLAATRP